MAAKVASIRNLDSYEKIQICCRVATLMYRTANEPHPPIMNTRADLPSAIAAVIDKALQKNPDTRYARGGDYARELRAAIAKAAGAGI